MLIDEILGRKEAGYNYTIIDGKIISDGKYHAKWLYNNLITHDGIYDNILEALDNGNNKDIQKELNNYIISNDYNTNICKYINSVDWL